MMTEQEKRAAFCRSTGRVATMNTVEYYAFCKGMEFGAASLQNTDAKASIEYTEWFPPNEKPARDGLYLIKYARGSDCWHIGYWCDNKWYSAGVAADGRPKTATYQLGEQYWWRGVTK